MSIMATSSHASEAFKQYVYKDQKGKQILNVPEGKYKGWIPRIIYSMHLEDVNLPFLRLASFPVGGTSIGNLMGMKSFNAVGNYLYLLPKSFGTCKSIEKLNLSFNHFQQIPVPVFNLETLTDLDFSDNDLTLLSPEIGKLKNLRILKLGGNILSEIPSELASCRKIEHLVISRKWYPRDGGMKELPKAACGLKELQYLDVSWHQIHTIPDEVGNLAKLESLNMKGNFLKYVSNQISKCSCLRELNLTGAMKLNSYIPPELFLLSELRTLNISNNYFSEISSDIKGLRKLRHFIIRRNALLRLPEELFELKYLETLELGDNYLDEISPSVKKMKKLKTLELQGNKLSVLPNEICSCLNLEHVCVAINELTSLPDDIYQLSNLRELDVSNNQLEKLPMLLDKLEVLGSTGLLNLTNNNLTVPPQEICNEGAESLFKFLRELRVSEARHRRKMILIGAAKAGKTSLRNALILGHSKLTAENERTWVLEQHLWEPDPETRVQVLDFGGHHIYSAAHHMFLTPEALHVLVFDLSQYKCNDTDSYHALIGNWLDAITDRAPGAVIKIVGTHSDLLKKDDMEEIVEDIMYKMKSIEEKKLTNLKIQLVRSTDALNTVTQKDTGTKFEDLDVQRLRDKQLSISRMLKTRSQLPQKIHIVSCADELAGVGEFREKLRTSLKESEERPLPNPWYRYLQEIANYPEKIMSFKKALHIFKDVMNSLNQSMISQQGSAVSSLEVVLKYLHTTGEIVWYADNPKLKEIVFHRPETLVEMLRCIFRHDFEKVVVYIENLGQIAGLNQKKFDAMKEDFLTQGIMTVELLHFCILHFNLSAEAREIFISLMLKFDLCYEVPSGLQTKYPSSRILKFPWFLSVEAPNEVFVKWPTKTPRDTIELSYQLQFPSKSPPNFFEKLCARLQNHISKREDWKNGVLAFRNRTKILLTREQRDGATEVLVAVRGSDLQEMWLLLIETYHDMHSLLNEWPLVPVEQYLLCTHCILNGDQEPHQYPAELLDRVCPRKVYQLQCCPKAKDKYIPACLVYPLETDFQDDVGEHIKTVEEFLKSFEEDTIDGRGSGILTDFGLMYVASMLGAEWSLVVSYLGLKQSEIEQIQLDNPYQVVKQISIALQRWRDRQQDKADDDLIKQLLNALTFNNRVDLTEEIKIKYGIKVTEETEEN